MPLSTLGNITSPVYFSNRAGLDTELHSTHDTDNLENQSAERVGSEAYGAHSSGDMYRHMSHVKGPAYTCFNCDLYATSDTLSE